MEVIASVFSYLHMRNSEFNLKKGSVIHRNLLSLTTTTFVSPFSFSFSMQNIPTEDIVNELERRVDCSKRRGVRTILIGNCVLL